MAKVLEQGESYDANSSGEKQTEELDGAEHDLKPPKNDKIKYIAIIGAAVAIVLVLLAVIVMKQLNTNTETEVEYEDTYEENAATALLYSDPSLTGEVSTEDLSTNMQEVVEEEPVDDSEAVELRKRGYTADEIDFYRSQGLSYDELIAKADEEIEQYQRSVLAELSDEGSEAYQTLLNMTWLQGNDLNITDVTYDEFSNVNAYAETKTMNIDYVKVPPKGTQLYLKCECLDYGVAFMTTTPERWLQLADSGNILVSVTIEYWNGTPIIIDITELDAGDREDYFSTAGGTDAGFN